MDEKPSAIPRHHDNISNDINSVSFTFCIVHTDMVMETTFLQNTQPWHRNDGHGQRHTGQQTPEMTLPHNAILQDSDRFVLYPDVLRIHPLQEWFLLVSFHPWFMIKGIAGAEGIHGHPSLAATAAIGHAVHVVR